MTQRAKPTQPSAGLQDTGYILWPLGCDGHALASGPGWIKWDPLSDPPEWCLLHPGDGSPHNSG